MRFFTAAVIVTVAGLALTAGASTTGKTPAGAAGSTQRSSIRAPKAAPKTPEQPKTEGKPVAEEKHGENAHEAEHAEASASTAHDEHADANTAADAHEESHEEATNTNNEEHAAAPAATSAPATTPTIDAGTAFTMLKEGNERWVSDKEQNPSTDPQRRQELAANGQHPFVTVLTCADSRLPVERIFDRGVGEIFTVRVAGNVAGDSEIGTIEYGTEHLKTPLLVVMGHTKCGAVAAAVSNAEVHGKVAELINHIEPAVDRARRMSGDQNNDAVAAAAVRENVWQSVTDLLKNSEICRTLVKNGELQVIGAVCDISTGKVEFMGEHPWQSELVAAFDAQGNSATANAEPANAHE